MPVTRAMTLLLLLFAGPALAAPTLTVSASPEAVEYGGRVKVTVKVRTEGTAGRPDLEVPELPGWALVGRSSQIRMDGFRGTQTEILELTLQARATGNLQIGEFRLRAGADLYVSKPITITVSDSAPGPSGPGGPAGPGAGRSGRQGRAVSPGTRVPAPPPAGDAELPPDDVAFLTWVTDRQTAWLGQSITAKLYIHYHERAGIRRFSMGKIDLAGFWNEKQDDPRRSRRRAVTIGGVRFIREAVAQYTLYPLRAGELSLPAATATLSLGRARRQTRIERSARPLPIVVKPLPKEGRPRGYRGLTVGRTTLKAKIERKRIRADEGVQLTVETRIEGMLQNVPQIELPDLEAFQVFPSNTETRVERGGTKRFNVRTQTWLLRPRKGGRLTIPSLALPYFEPGSGVYRTARTSPLSVTVRGQPKGSSGGRAVAEDDPDTLKLRSIRPHIDLELRGTAGSPVLWFYSVLCGTPLAFLLLLGIDRVRAERDRSASSRAARGAAKRAHSALTKAQRLTPKLGYAAVAKALIEFLEVRFERPFKGLTRERMIETLRDHGVSQAAIAALAELLETCDFARFAGEDDADLAASIRSGAALIARVDTEGRP